MGAPQIILLALVSLRFVFALNSPPTVMQVTVQDEDSGEDRVSTRLVPMWVLFGTRTAIFGALLWWGGFFG